MLRHRQLGEWALGGGPAAEQAVAEEAKHRLVPPMVMIIMNQSVNMNHIDVKLWKEQSLLLWSEIVLNVW